MASNRRIKLIATLAILVFAVLFWFKISEDGVTFPGDEPLATPSEGAATRDAVRTITAASAQFSRKRLANATNQGTPVSALSVSDASSGDLDASPIAASPNGPAPLRPKPRLAEIELVWIDPGTFLMGSSHDELGRRDNEGPPTLVTITSGFWMGKYEITLDQFRRVIAVPALRMKVWESWGGGPDRAVNEVSWQAATNFCGSLTKGQRALGTLPEGFVYRLPTEAEWEFACRGGSKTRFSFGDNPAQLENYAWYGDQFAKAPRSVGLKNPNDWGLYDMHGNVAEWCLDILQNTTGDPLVDPVGIIHSDFHIKRGGSWDFPWEDCRSAWRNSILTIYHDTPQATIQSGFRIVLARPIDMTRK